MTDSRNSALCRIPQKIHTCGKLLCVQNQDYIFPNTASWQGSTKKKKKVRCSRANKLNSSCKHATLIWLKYVFRITCKGTKAYRTTTHYPKKNTSPLHIHQVTLISSHLTYLSICLHHPSSMYYSYLHYPFLSLLEKGRSPTDVLHKTN